MSRMSDLYNEICIMYYNDYSDYAIAEKLNVSLDFVRDTIAGLEEEDYYWNEDSMDGDFDSAMTSAGFGTDEDYGYYGE
jgi:hypothetical protein